MKNHKFSLLKNRKAGDRVEVTFNIPSNIYLMTEKNYVRYKKDQQFVRMLSQGTVNAYVDVPFDGEWYLIIEPSNSNELIASYKVKDVDGSNWKDINAPDIIVHNAPNTGGKHPFDKADYWEEQKGKKIPDTGFICRSCHETINRDEVDGAHVKISHATNSKMYFVPICRSCNRSHEDKDFIVPTSWLVEAPKEDK